jgi:hypothetical protein
VQGRERRKVGGSGSVAFHAQGAGAVGLWGHAQGGVVLVIDPHTELLHLVQGQVDVGLAGQLAGDLDLEAARQERRDDEQARQVLARDIARYLHGAGERGAAEHLRREVAIPAGFDARAELDQRIEQRLVRARLHRGVPIDGGQLRPQRRHGQEQPRGDRTLAREELDGPRREVARTPDHAQLLGRPIIDLDGETLQALLHAPVVVAFAGEQDLAFAVGEGRDRAVPQGERLAAGQAEPKLDGPGPGLKRERRWCLLRMGLRGGSRHGSVAQSLV